MLTKAVERRGYGSHFSRIGYTDAATSNDDEFMADVGQGKLIYEKIYDQL